MADFLLGLCVLGRLTLLLGLCWLFGEKIQNVLLVFSLSEEVGRIDVVHLVLMESGYFHLDGILSLLFLERTQFLLELYPDGLGVSI